MLSPPSLEAHQAIKKLWSMNHSVFPILPQKAPYLTHLMTESRCEGVLIPREGLDESMKEAAGITGKCLGIPIIPFDDCGSVIDVTDKGVILEAQSRFSTVPMAAGLNTQAWASYIERNQRLFKDTQSHVLSLGRNWLLDAESFKHSLYVPSSQGSMVAPEICILDTGSTREFLHAIEIGAISTEKIFQVVIDAPLSFETESIIDDSTEELGRMFPTLMVRFIVPEIGPVGELVSIHSLSSTPAWVDSRNGFSGYIGRELSSKEGLSGDGLFATSFALVKIPERTRQRRIAKGRTMAPDWRVRKVPIAVYHKKRGFKGQIYYTTKHKGWTFYKSRYYN